MKTLLIIGGLLIVARLVWTLNALVSWPSNSLSGPRLVCEWHEGRLPIFDILFWVGLAVLFLASLAVAHCGQGSRE
ncbi:MAG TPA: hypothetical protein VFX59_14435 [Polyangiales bacterium]|nr:hypothetical protein [Polyangiales bacterium]